LATTTAATLKSSSDSYSISTATTSTSLMTSVNLNQINNAGNYQSKVTLINITWIDSTSMNSLNFTMSSSGMSNGKYFAFGLSLVN